MTPCVYCGANIDLNGGTAICVGCAAKRATRPTQLGYSFIVSQYEEEQFSVQKRPLRRPAKSAISYRPERRSLAASATNGSRVPGA
jgi:hypothetical protein